VTNNTDFLFDKGKLTILMDAQYGSSGKGKAASFIGEHSNKWQFACNAFSAQAGHWVKLDDGREYFYQQLNSVAYMVDKYEKLYIGPASCIELPALLREIKENKVPEHKLGISPIATIIQDFDAEYERGTRGFDDTPSLNHTGTSKRGSTCHGVGSATARKVLRKDSVVCVKDVPELRPYVCNVGKEITDRLNSGQSGLLEIAQGFTLSLNHDHFYPYCTSRNVTTAQALSDMFIPPVYAGQLVLNFRTLPIRINSNKYIAEDGRHLVWDEVQRGVPHTVFEGSSGHWYPDQKELTWEEVTESSGSPEPLLEKTSVTQLPRRIATFSRQNLEEAILYNRTGRGKTTISVNFANYIDHEMFGKRTGDKVTDKFNQWFEENFTPFEQCFVKFFGTGPLTNDTIQLD
jgi:adenylosuccinate synthase